MKTALGRAGRTCEVERVGKPEGRRPLEIPRCIWENDIKMGI